MSKKAVAKSRPQGQGTLSAFLPAPTSPAVPQSATTAPQKAQEDKPLVLVATDDFKMLDPKLKNAIGKIAALTSDTLNATRVCLVCLNVCLFSFVDCLSKLYVCLFVEYPHTIDNGIQRAQWGEPDERNREAQSDKPKRPKGAFWMEHRKDQTWEVPAIDKRRSGTPQHTYTSSCLTQIAL